MWQWEFIPNKHVRICNLLHRISFSYLGRILYFPTSVWFHLAYFWFGLLVLVLVFFFSIRKCELVFQHHRIAEGRINQVSVYEKGKWAALLDSENLLGFVHTVPLYQFKSGTCLKEMENEVTQRGTFCTRSSITAQHSAVPRVSL